MAERIEAPIPDGESMAGLCFYVMAGAEGDPRPREITGPFPTWDEADAEEDRQRALHAWACILEPALTP